MMPTRSEVEEYATALWRKEHASVTFILPEVEELKESGYLARAQSELMRGQESKDNSELRTTIQLYREEIRKLEAELSDLSVDEVRERLKILETRLDVLEKRPLGLVEGLFKCLRCGHTWDKRDRTVRPNICPRCKTKKWDMPKKLS